MGVYQDEGDLELGKEAEVGVEERDGVGDLPNTVVWGETRPMRTPLTPEVLCLRAWRTSFMYAFWAISHRNSPPMTH